jgi:hypothetical protein
MPAAAGSSRDDVKSVRLDVDGGSFAPGKLIIYWQPTPINSLKSMSSEVKALRSRLDTPKGRLLIYAVFFRSKFESMYNIKELF